MRALVRELIETVFLALTIFLALQFSVQNFRVEGPSMEPTLKEGQHILVNKIVYLQHDLGDLLALLPFVTDKRPEATFAFHPPQRGDVIVFQFPRDPSRDFVKRVIGIPGDTIEIRRGEVFVNGVVLNEPYVVNADQSQEQPTVVPPDSYYVLGDNRRASLDSRDWGPVPADHVIGRGWLRYWPIDGVQVLSSFNLP